MSRRNSLKFLATLSLLATMCSVHAQAKYPNKPIRLVVPAAPIVAGPATNALLAGEVQVMFVRAEYDKFGMLVKSKGITADKKTRG